MFNTVVDLMVKINDGGSSKLKYISIKYTLKGLNMMTKLYEMGLIQGFYFKENKMVILFKYYNGKSLFKSLSLVNKLSSSEYWNLMEMKKNKEKNEMILYMISTSKGMLLDSECLALSVGGEVLLKVEL